MSSINTFTGKTIDPFCPDPDAICIEDIAHALSLICRGNGHVRTFYSVAQHSVSCAEEARLRGYGPEVEMICLLHDCAEAYLSDVPRPLKDMMPFYNETEDRLLNAVLLKFTGRTPSDKQWTMVKEIDDAMLSQDLRDLLGIETEVRPAMHVQQRAFRPFDSVEKEFLERFNELSLFLTEAPND